MDEALKLYTRQEAAQTLRISVSQLDNEARRGRIKRVKMGARGKARVLYRPQDLAEYVAACVVGAEAN